MRFREWLYDQLLMEDPIVANYLQAAANSLAKRAKEDGDRTVIILGRDAWWLVPLLKRRGVKVQYFLLSRLQIGNQTTKEQWLKEVPPGSIVVDTGYMGSVFRFIRGFDPTVRAYQLMSSAYKDKYPQLDVGKDFNADDVVDKIEAIPKFLPRSVGYHPITGVARVRKNPYGEPDDITEKPSKAADVIRQNTEDLQQLGLSDDEIEYYKRFAGITPKERIGHSDVEGHYNRVAHQRKHYVMPSDQRPEIWGYEDEDEDE